MKTYREKGRYGKNTGRTVAEIGNDMICAYGKNVTEAKNNLVEEIEKYLRWNREEKSSKSA